MTPRLKSLLGNVLVCVAATAVALVAGELVVRAFFKDDIGLYPRYHTDYHYGKYTLRGVRPSSDFWYTSVDGHWRFVTNSHGFRSTREFSYDKPAGTVRILALGDSHTFGTEVRQDQTFSAAAERYLVEHRVHAEAINTGVSGYSNAEELALLENEGYKYHPDVVVLGFYANDFEDNLKAGLFALDADGRLVEKKYEHIPGVRIQNVIYAIPPVRWLSENSYFYSLLFNSVWEHFKTLATQAATRSAAASAPTAIEYAVPTGEASKSEMDLAAALIERMQRFCAQHSMRLIVVDIPVRKAERRVAPSLPPEMRARLERAGVEVLHTEELLAPYENVAEMHVPHGQQHISEFTHTVIGAEIGRRVLAALPRGVQPVDLSASR